MSENNWVIIVDDVAKAHLKEAYDYIRVNSPRNARKIISKITSSISELSKNPEKYPPDKYRLDKDNFYRAYEIERFRIAYHFTFPQIRIIRIRHTSREPLSYR
jgi:plasmid stabilization system protein ParE